MSQPESDPNEQANISGADFAIMCDELKTLRAELTEARRQLKEASEQEPDEWRCISPGGTTTRRLQRPAMEVHKAQGWTCIPLYTNAPVPQPAVPEAVAVDSETKEFFLSHRFDQLGKYPKDRALILLTEAGFNFVRAAILSAKEKGQ